MPWEIVVPILGIVFAPLLTYIVAKQRASGSPKTTEADTLWGELRAELVAYRGEVGGMRTEIGTLHGVIADLEGVVVSLNAEVKRLNAVVKRLNAGPRRVVKGK